ncbi:hypothetical protein JB92DRAFT_709055 [Gautieria morchelliformis]|nr:hypothetical protein JB92DRAFT_709055 [Gautieria morchelliformis]
MSSEAPTLSVSYDLRPPSSTSAPPNLSATTTHAIPLQSTSSESGRSSGTYYAALRDAIAKAKDITGRALTEWRDAVGDGEKEKTGGTAEVDQEEPDEEEGGPK